MTRTLSVFALALVASLGISYGLFLVAVALGFDGPGPLTVSQAVVRAVLPVAGAVLGFVGTLPIAHFVFHRALAALLAMTPGIFISLFLISMIWRDTRSLLH